MAAALFQYDKFCMVMYVSHIPKSNTAKPCFRNPFKSKMKTSLYNVPIPRTNEIAVNDFNPEQQGYARSRNK